MDIINKSGNGECSNRETFYVILEPSVGDIWMGGEFHCNHAPQYFSEDDAIEGAAVGTVVAKITLVAKIV